MHTYMHIYIIIIKIHSFNVFSTIHSLEYSHIYNTCRYIIHTFYHSYTYIQTYIHLLTISHMYIHAYTIYTYNIYTISHMLHSLTCSLIHTYIHTIHSFIMHYCICWHIHIYITYTWTHSFKYLFIPTAGCMQTHTLTRTNILVEIKNKKLCS